MTETTTTPAGWYPDTANPSLVRYWDGAQWTEHTQPAAGYVGTGTPGTAPTAVLAPAKKPWFKRKGIMIPLGIVGGIILLSSLINAINGGGDDPAPAADTDSSVVEEEPAVEEPAAEAPAEEAPAEEPAAPAGPTGEWASPLAQPYTAKGMFGGEKYTLTARLVNTDANDTVEGWNQFNEDAPAGFKYVIVEYTMTGIDKDGVEPSLASFDLFLSTGEGNKYSDEFIVFGDGMPSMMDGPTLYPGVAFTGYAAYLVPADSATFMLYDNSHYISF